MDFSRREMLGLMGTLGVTGEALGEAFVGPEAPPSPRRLVDEATQARRDELYALMGELPDRNRPISAKRAA